MHVNVHVHDVLTIIAAAEKVVRTGASSAETITRMNAGVTVTLEISNWTKYPLTDTVAVSYRGNISSFPVEIAPGKTEMFYAKQSAMLSGTCGTISWKVKMTNKPDQRRVVVKWDMPFNHVLFKKSFGVGLTRPGVVEHDMSQKGHAWFHGMSGGGCNTATVLHNLLLYDRAARNVTFSDGRFEVVGNMGTSHVANGKVIFRPKLEDNPHFTDDIYEPILKACSKDSEDD